jgi:hypothetical protein
MSALRNSIYKKDNIYILSFIAWKHPYINYFHLYSKGVIPALSVGVYVNVD